MSLTPGEPASYATDQFYDIYNIEPYGPKSRSRPADNPPYAWPKNKTHYVDGVNPSTTQKIQRGYMRSLTTDLNVDPSATNRRLFFQFNPQAIRREVSQTPGAMLPLLQSPEQLMQPVPGVSTFGFSLMFNREAEVNQGLTPVVESVSLPNGDPALVSQVGVLADLLVLDIITGQGISQDLISSIAKRQVNLVNKQIEIDKKYLENLPEAAKAESLKTYVPIEPIDTNELTEKFNINIGNSAFLNPLPFRVMFSTLFMVEGIATSVEVNFTKFSQTMVPTQCTVNISMYALYIGFAKKNTFLYDNLVQGAKDTREQNTKDDKVTKKLSAGVKKVNFEDTVFDQAYNDPEKAFFCDVDVVKTELFKKQLEKKEIKDVTVRITLEFFLTSVTTITATESQFKNGSSYDLTLKGESAIPIDKFKKIVRLHSNDFFNEYQKQLKLPVGEALKYINFRYKVVVTGSDDGGVLQDSIPYHSKPEVVEIINYTPFYDTRHVQNITAYNSIANVD